MNTLRRLGPLFFVLAACPGPAPSVTTTPDTFADTVVSDVRPDTLDPDTGVRPDTLGPDTDVGSPDPGPDAAIATEQVVNVPLGETLFFDGDDYLYFWGLDSSPVTIVSSPFGAAATPRGGSPGRLTPDVVGEWILQRGDSRIMVVVADDLLNADTFLNYNYTPTQPIALDGQQRLWITCPPSNAVQRVDVDTGGGATKGPLVPTGSWPTAVVQWPGTAYMLVSQAGRDTLGLLDTESGRIIDAIRVGDEPAGIAVDVDHPAGPRAWVAISGADAVAEIDLDAFAVTQTLVVSRDPRAVAYDATSRRLYVASLLSSNGTPLGPLTETPIPREQQHDIAVIDTNDFKIIGWVNEVATLVRGLHLPPGSAGKLLATVSHSKNATEEVNASSRPHHHGLAIIDLTAGAAPDIGTVQQLDLDVRTGSAGPAPSPHSIATSPDGAFLVATLSAGNALLLMDATSYEEVGRVTAGSDPRGLVFAHGHMWTFASLDNLLQSWPLSVLAQPETADGLRAELEVGDDPRPEDIAAGQRLFNDAAFSGTKAFSCNNCHIDGLTDGLVWNILLDGNVNTLAFRNVGGTGPFLWGGVLPTLFDFSREVLRLVGADPSSEDMARLTVYMQSVTAPPNPHTLPGGKFSAEAERGRALFEGPPGLDGAGCTVCHSGPLLTNRQLVQGKTEGLQTDVPSLVSVYDSGPWGRQGQWTTLEDMVDFAVTFTGATLDLQQMSDLNAYVRELPGDLLYLNAAKPLDGTNHTFPATPIELTFSAALRTGQEDLFSLVVTSDGDTLVDGSFNISGRFVRFTPVDAQLPLDSTFELRIGDGLEGVFGQTTSGPQTVRFETGGVPSVDITGAWLWEISGILSGEVVVSFIQSPGGQVGGVVLDGGGLIDLDHLEGFVSDDLLLIEPFLVEGPFGTVTVEGVNATMVDGDGDGLADTGSGEVLNPFATVNVTMTRLEAYCPTCCGTDSDCDDNDPDTVDACEAGACENTLIPCLEDVDCVAELGCMVGSCTAANTCTFTAATWPSCCEADVDCFDGVDGTADTCVNHQCVHAPGPAVSCTTDDQCVGLLTCAETVCATQAGQCSTVGASDGPGCCTLAAQCPLPSGASVCEVPACLDFQCGTETAGGPTIYQADFGAWTVVNDDSGAGWVYEESPPFGTTIRYGNLETDNYDVGVTTGTATSPVIDLPAGVTEFSMVANVYLDIDATVGKDVLTIELLVDGTAVSTLLTVDGSPGSGNIGTSIPFDADAPFQIRLTFDSVDGEDNTGEGVWIDLLWVKAECVP